MPLEARRQSIENSNTHKILDVKQYHYPKQICLSQMTASSELSD